MSISAKPANRLLSALSAKTFKSLSPQLEKYPLVLKQDVFAAGDVITHVYFPESGIISLLTAVEERSTLEVGIVGNEGMVGLSLFLDQNTTNTRAVVQGSGNALRMKAAHFRKECARSDELPKVLRRFTHELLIQISQSAVCNRFHPVEERFARWLLMTADRMNSNEFLITQDFLSNMLGVRREAVNRSAGKLQQDALISYQRGNLMIHNRKKLEAAACACYALVSNHK